MVYCKFSQFRAKALPTNEVFGQNFSINLVTEPNYGDAVLGQWKKKVMCWKRSEKSELVLFSYNFRKTNLRQFER